MHKLLSHQHHTARAPAWRTRSQEVIRSSLVMTHVQRTSTAQEPSTASEIIKQYRHLPDAHCHPQDDLASGHQIDDVQATAITAMGVRESDWQNVIKLYQSAPHRIVPCFGVHPWFAHLHDSSMLDDCEANNKPGKKSPNNEVNQQCSYNGVLEVPASQDTAALHAALLSNARQAGMLQHVTAQQTANNQLLNTDKQEATSTQENMTQNNSNHHNSNSNHGCNGSDFAPSQTWVDKLEQLLVQHPQAIVGEFGLDRAAVIPGTKAHVSLAHQLRLVRHHLLLAGRLNRPVSMHCVRATGAMQDVLQSIDPQQLPQRIMMHSFNGPPDSIKQLSGLKSNKAATSKATKQRGVALKTHNANKLLMLKHGVGDRLWFSFSTVIATKDGDPIGADKLMARMKAVPDDRLLIESDQHSLSLVDESLDAVLHLVAEAKGWSLQQAADKMVANFEAFFDGYLPKGYSRDLKQISGV